MRTIPVLTVAVTCLTLTIATAATSQAAPGDTPVTFAIAAGSGLSISVPAGPVSLGVDAAPGSTVSKALGVVTVTDARTLVIAGGWTAVVSSSDYTNPAASSAIPKSAMTYTPSTASTSGIAVFTPGLAAAFGGTAQTAYQARTVVGNNTAAWNPTLSVAIPTDAIVGTYSGTVTHSVS